ncbi:hypothetical protein V2W45_1406108 [Cenococcum geophilum]
MALPIFRCLFSLCFAHIFRDAGSCNYTERIWVRNGGALFGWGAHVPQTDTYFGYVEPFSHQPLDGNSHLSDVSMHP